MHKKEAYHVHAGKAQAGVRVGRAEDYTIPLNTEELIELLYGLYNPTEFEKLTEPGEKMEKQ